jgi:hypothetical protein
MNVPAELLRLLDEVVKSSLQASRDSYFIWLLYATGVVFIGVVLEQAEELPFPKPQWDILRGRYRVVYWGRRIAWLGWALILAGVAGECICEGLMSKYDGLLQEFSSIRVSSAGSRASEVSTFSRAIPLHGRQG